MKNTVTRKDTAIRGELYSQDSLQPNRKVGMGLVVGGPLGVVIVYILASFFMPESNPVTQDVFGLAVVSLVGSLATTATSWTTKDRA